MRAVAGHLIVCGPVLALLHAPFLSPQAALSSACAWAVIAVALLARHVRRHPRRFPPPAPEPPMRWRTISFAVALGTIGLGVVGLLADAAVAGSVIVLLAGLSAWRLRPRRRAIAVDPFGHPAPR